MVMHLFVIISAAAMLWFGSDWMALIAFVMAVFVVASEPQGWELDGTEK